MRHLLSLFLAISFFLAAKSQPGGSFQNLITVGTTSPDVASLGKFGNVPVSYNTGATSVSIPLYEINIGKIKLPLSFDYHTGGIRVDETSSSVGIGWALNGIGVVSRNMIGLPDDGPGGYLYSPSPDSLFNDWSGTSYGSTIDAQYAQFLYSTRNGPTTESEPDIYSYSINGQSGKFIFKRDGSILQIPKTNNQILRISGGNFEIIDENGIAYIFDLVEHTQHTTGNPLSYVSAWHLSKMIDQNIADTIYFTYQAACSVNSEKFMSDSYSFGLGPNCATPNQPSPADITYQGANFSTTTIIHPDELFPSKINWRGGQVSFLTACDRQDKAGEQRIKEVDVYANQKNGLQLVKTIKPYQSYFYSNLVPNYTPTDERNYRLRLDSVSFVAVNTGDQPLVYRMTYSTQPIASRESAAQDQWGFNNGQYGNPSTMPTQTILYNGSYHVLGNANRNPDSLSMLACSISSIQYPTGGKSVFEFEPHQYPTNQSYVQQHSVVCAAYGSVQTTSSITFTPDVNASGVMYTYAFTRYNFTGVTNRPTITVLDQTTSTSFQISSNIDPTQPINNNTTPTPWSPIQGHTYLITVNLYSSGYTGSPSDLNASITISWGDVFANIPVIGVGGGLRVKSVTNLDAGGNFINKDIYKYGTGDNGLGQLLTPATYLLVNYENTTYRCGWVPPGDDPTTSCLYYTQNPNPTSITYHANSVLPAAQFSGSPVLYGSATKYSVDSLGNAINGKSTYQYFVFDDQSAYASTDYGKVGVLMISEGWKNGLLGEEDDYTYDAVNGYKILKRKINNYLASRQLSVQTLKIKSIYNWNTSQCYQADMGVARGEYLLVEIPVYTGAMLLQYSIDSTWDINGKALRDSVYYGYADTTHLFPTIKQTVDSKGALWTENYKYPHDFAVSGNVYSTMLNRNIIAPLIQTQTLNNGAQVSLGKVNYLDWFGNTKLLMPQTVDQQVGSNPVETRIRFNQFDVFGNILQQQKVGDGFQSYIWDYKSTYPIAKVSNAAAGDIAYTSFEMDGTGNWTLTDTARNRTYAITGSQSYNLVTGKTISKTVSTGQYYIVSYWSRSGAVTVTANGVGAAVSLTGLIKNGWTYYEHLLPATTTSVAITATSAIIDELRLYPKTAQMITYTYNPLIGMSSLCSVNNNVAYYEYDGLNRLKDIRDMDKNAVKLYEYGYQVKPGFSSVLKTASFSRNNCSSGYMSGPPIVYTVPAGKYISGLSQASADLLATNELNTNGQAYANANIACVLIIYYNVAKSGNFTRNNCTSCYIGSVVNYVVAANTYTSTVSQADADSKAQNDVNTNGQAYANAHGTCTAPGNTTINGSNTSSVPVYMALTNICSHTVYNYQLMAHSTPSLGPLPVGVYNVTFTTSGFHTFWINSLSTSGTNTATISNVTLGASNTESNN